MVCSEPAGGRLLGQDQSMPLGLQQCNFGYGEELRALMFGYFSVVLENFQQTISNNTWKVLYSECVVGDTLLFLSNPTVARHVTIRSSSETPTTNDSL